MTTRPFDRDKFSLDTFSKSRLVRLMERDQRRGIEVRAEDLSSDGVLTLSVSSDLPYGRSYGDEVLVHDKRSVRLARFDSGTAPLLLDHENSVRNQIGVIKRAWFDSGKLRVEARLSKREDLKPILDDIRDGIIGNASIGYSIHDYEEQRGKDGERSIFRVTDWEPYEVSIVSVPADQSVGVGRGRESKGKSMPEKVIEEPKQEGNIKVIREAREMTDAEREKATGDIRKAELERSREIINLANKHNVPADARDKAIADGKSVDEFRRYLLDDHLPKQGVIRQVPQTAGGSEIGMSEREIKRYSLVECLRNLASNRPLPGLAREASDAMAKIVGRDPQGFYIPADVANRNNEELTREMGNRNQRGLVSYTGSAGGYTVGTDLLSGSMVTLLRNRQVFTQVGATQLSGLVGDVAIPKQTGGATAYWLSEVGTSTTSQQTFGQLMFVPHRLAGETGYSKQLLHQSSLSIEAFVRDDLMRVLAIEMDRAHINGLGAAGEPLGLLNTTGINTVTFGAAPTYAKMVEFESLIEDDNAVTGSMAYVTTPLGKGKLKTVEVASGTARFLWDMGEVNGYPAFTSKQIPSERTIFGVWSEAIIATWDGIDVVVDPYTLASSNQIRIVINMRTDFGVRQPTAFCASTDATNQ